MTRAAAPALSIALPALSTAERGNVKAHNLRAPASAREAAAGNKGRPLAIGFGRPVAAGSRTVELSRLPWQTLSDGSRAARIQIASPDAAWLLLRSLETLALRVERQSTTAHQLARRLSEHDAVELVRYPGLGPDPRAARYMQGGFGGMLSFDVRGDAVQVETATQVIRNATSLGGVRSTLESRRRWEGERVPEGLIRLSVGLEDVDELWADLEQALAKA